MLTETDSVSILEILSQLEAHSLGTQTDQSETEVGKSWRGLVFSVDKWNLVVPFIHEFEIVPFQTLLPLPMTKVWVKGMLNIRGEIYTVIDFSEFIGSPPVQHQKTTNLLLLPDKELKSALLISGRISLRLFDINLPTVSKDSFSETLGLFLSTALDDGGSRWGVLNVQALSSSNQFNSIGRT